MSDPVKKGWQAKTPGGRGMQFSTKVSRRTFLEIAGTTTLSAALASCGFGVGGNNQTSGNSNTVSLWDIRVGSEQQVVQATVNDFNAQQSKIHVALSFFQNDPYKQKLQVAMGAHNPPDIFFGWGGGILKTYIDAGDVYDMTSALNADPTWKNRYLPAVLSAVTFDNKIYGVPNSGMQPVLFFYNKALFDQYHLQPPQTWSDLLQVINTLKQQNIIPIALAGGSKWPLLMYEEYLVDRFGGPDAFNAVLANQANAWSQDAFIKANTAIQQLVDAGAFGSAFSSVIADTNQDAALLYTGKAGMMLQGNWNFPIIQTQKADFLNNLGWFPFPAVEGGQGDPANAAGNPCNFYSITTTAKSPQNGLTVLKATALNDAEVRRFVAIGDIPAVQGLEAQLSSAKNSEWLLFNYNLVKNAPHYQLSWDQALPPQPAQALLTNLDQLFLKQISPQQFSDNMNQTLG
jgi:raffinose/stachyose/melibiose transport system substrate-binding protein